MEEVPDSTEDAFLASNACRRLHLLRVIFAFVVGAACGVTLSLLPASCLIGTASSPILAAAEYLIPGSFAGLVSSAWILIERRLIPAHIKILGVFVTYLLGVLAFLVGGYLLDTLARIGYRIEDRSRSYCGNPHRIRRCSWHSPSGR